MISNREAMTASDYIEQRDFDVVLAAVLSHGQSRSNLSIDMKKPALF